MKRTTLFFLACAVLGLAACTLASGGAPLTFVSRAEPFVVTCALSAGFAAASFAFGAATGDYSWVDRLWSLVPVLFAWLYALRAGFAAPSLAAALLVTLWGARLTRNFARRGGYSGSEDYRWSVLRSRMASPLLWQLFNAGFICAFQLGVIALFASPLGLLAEVGPPGAGLLPVVAPAVLCLGFLAIETEADREQWEFQARKAAFLALPEGRRGADDEARRGFRSSGLFRLSRHPAYFGELGFWWSVCLLGSWGSGRPIHWSAAGAAALTCLFVGSTRFTESITAAKYPAYREYRAATSAVLPWFPRDVAGGATARGGRRGNRAPR
jgi:steroid 5-alpha reductase family enzyme